MASAAGGRGPGRGARRHGHGPVGLDHVDLPALGPQPVGQHVPGDGRPGQQDPPRPGRRTPRAAPRPRLGRAPGRRPAATAQGGGRARADGGDAGAGQGPGVAEQRQQPLDRVGRGEHHPAVLAAASGGRPPRRRAAPPSAGVGDPDGRHLDGLGAQGPQPGGQPAGLLPGPGDHDAPAEEGPALVPGQVEAGDGADDDRGRRLEGDRRPARPRVVRTVVWSGRVPHRTAATGVSGGQAAGHQPGRDLGPVGHPHQDDDGAAGGGQRLPVGLGVDRVAAVAGDDGERGGQAPVGDRDAGVGGHGDRRGDAGHHLEGDAGRGQGQRLLAAPAEHERVAALEPHHGLAGPAPVDEQGVDRVLVDRAAGRLADVDPLGAGRGQVEQRWPRPAGRGRPRRPGPAPRRPAR